MNRIKQFWKHQQGMAVVEFALLLPVLMTLFYGCIETTRFILATQKVEKLANSVADVTAQSTRVTNAGMTQLMAATSDIMNPFTFGANGRVIVSSLYRAPGTDAPVVNWQYSGGGTLTGEDSRIGVVGASPVMPVEDFAFEERENIIAAEVFYRFAPLLTSEFFGTRTIYRQAFYKPRFGALTSPPS